ncbi:MAG: hypothetical protein JW927_22780 [Deltaproteobacteria bacterium]|nr:hypothetical protein [Deltaproteobacteria bacterium]
MTGDDLFIKYLNIGLMDNNMFEPLNTGYIEALYYVAAVRSDLSIAAVERIFGDVHMINHINLHEINRVRQLNNSRL